MDKIFKKRQGATSLDTEYEDLVIVNLILLLLTSDNIDDFRISASNAQFGAFDDVVLEILSNSEWRIYAIQMRHKSGKEKTLTVDALNAENGNFGVEQYFQSYQSMEHRINCKYFLFTNLKFEKKENTMETNKTEKTKGVYQISLFKQKHLFDISGRKGHCYRFHKSGNDSRMKNENTNEYDLFLDNFFLYTDQDGVDDLRTNINKTLEQMFSCNNEAIDKFIKFVSEWGKREGKKEKLSKTWTQQIIAMCMLQVYIKQLSFVKNFGNHYNNYQKRHSFVQVNKGLKILQNIISSFNVTVFEQEKYDKVKLIWNDALEEVQNVKEIELVLRKYQLNANGVTREDKIDNLFTQILWIMNKCPLVVSDSSTTRKVLKYFSTLKFVLLKDKSPIEENLRHFEKLSDLDENSEMYTDIIRNFKCSIQGKKKISLETLIEENKEIASVISTTDLLEISYGSHSIGGNQELLPVPYINRHLAQNCLDVKLLQQMDEETLIVLYSSELNDELETLISNCKFVDVANYLAGHDIDNSSDYSEHEFGSTIYVSPEECSVRKLEEICKKNGNAKKYHHFGLIKGKLKWIRSSQGVTDLERYKLKDYFKAEETFLWSEKPKNLLTIIIGEPGLGKTELMKNLCNNFCDHFFTVILYPKHIYSLTELLKETSDHIRTFKQFILNEKLKNMVAFEKSILNALLKRTQVVFIWEALDEISEDEFRYVIPLILQLNDEGFIQRVTARTHFKYTLEKEFNVLAIDLIQFSEKDQENYIKKRLRDDSEITQNIIVNTKSMFTFVKGKNILGIPLLIFMLTELFRDNTGKKEYFWSYSFNLIDLYDHFVDQKFDRFYKEKLNIDFSLPQTKKKFNIHKKNKLQTYEEAAMVSILPKETLDKISYTNSENYQQFLKTDIGLIANVQNKIPRFVHNTFAEYFVAKYLSRKSHLLRGSDYFLFERRLTNVRFFFDLLLAKNSLPHIAVLYQDIDFFQKYDKYLENVDENERSVLHLASSWGERYAPLKVHRDNKTYIVDDENVSSVVPEKEQYLKMLAKLILRLDIFKFDDLYGLTSVSYAEKSDCLIAKLKIVEAQGSNVVWEYDTCINILYYSARLGYDFVLDMFNSKQIRIKNISDPVPYVKTKKKFESLFHLSIDNNNQNYLFKLLNINNYKAKINDPNKFGTTALLLACFNGHEEIVTSLIKASASVNLNDQNGTTPLYVACQKGLAKIVASLIEAGADINKARGTGDTPLLMACTKGYDEIITLLIKADANIDLANKMGTTPLYMACQKGHTKIVASLIKCGADINKAAETGDTPLLMACTKRHEEIISLLLKAGANFDLANKEGTTSLYIACQEGLAKIVLSLVKAGADVNKARHTGDTALLMACTKGHEEIVTLLIKAGANIHLANKMGTTSLYMACQKDHVKILVSLIKAGADINKARHTGDTPLLWACTKGYEEIASSLIKADANIDHGNKMSLTPLYMACQEGHTKIVMSLIKAGADINKARDTGDTPLLMACTKGHEVIVTLLIKADANIDLANKMGLTPLCTACQKGYAKIVVSLIKAGADINKTGDTGDTPLLWACTKGHEEIVSLLIQADANIDLANKRGFTPLYMAGQEGHSKIIVSLIKAGANVNKDGNKGSTPLHVACFKGHGEIVGLLIKADANIDLTNKMGLTSLYLACQEGHAKIVMSLIKAGADINKARDTGDTPLLMACTKGHEEIATSLIKADANIDHGNKRGLTPLYIACQGGHAKIVMSLIKAGADINKARDTGDTPLLMACTKGHEEIATSLIKADANIDHGNKMGLTPLYIACQGGHAKIVMSLIKAGADINKARDTGDTPLLMACTKGHEEIATSLIKADANIDHGNKRGLTPLYIACQGGHAKIVMSLIKVGADINKARDTGDTPLLMACTKGYDEIVTLLIKADANIDLANKMGTTPLCIACHEGDAKIVVSLIKAGADINKARDEGDTPLLMACTKGHDEIVTLFIKADANIDLANKMGTTPLYMACQEGHAKIVDFLIKAGADVNNQDRNRGSTPLYIACSKGYQEIVTSLIKAGADIDRPDHDGTTPLLMACLGGYLTIVTSLINAGANVNRANINGGTPLWTARITGRTEIVNLLRQAGARSALFERILRIIRFRF